MRKILLAIGSSAAEDRLKNNQELSSEFIFTNIATHRDSILQIARKEKPDIILIKETLGGNSDILGIVFSLRSEIPNARIIFMTGPKNPGDSLMNSLVSCGVYDILMASTFSITSIVDAIKKPKTFGDVSQYIVSSEMQKIMTFRPEQKEYVAPEKDKFNNQTKFQPSKDKNEDGNKEPQEFGYLKIDDGQRKTNQDYSPILVVNKGTAGKSFKPITSKPDISQIEEIIFDDEDMSHDNKNTDIEQKQESKEVKNLVENLPKDILLDKEEAPSQDEQEELITYDPPTGNDSFIKNNRQFKENSLKNNLVLDKKKNEEDLVEEIKFSKSKDSSDKKIIVKIEDNKKQETKVKTNKTRELKSSKPIDDNEITSNTVLQKSEELKQNKINSSTDKKEEFVDGNKKTNKRTCVYSFVKYYEYSENHASLNIALALARTNKVLFLMIKDNKRNGIETFIDSMNQTTWYSTVENNLEFKKVSKYEVLSLVNKDSVYDYILIDTYYDKEFCGLLDSVSDQMIHIAFQQRALFDFIYDSNCRKDIVAIVNYKNELLSAKTVFKEGKFKTVIKVSDTEIEDFNAFNSKVPSMGRKNNAKTLKDYESLLIALREDK